MNLRTLATGGVMDRGDENEREEESHRPVAGKKLSGLLIPGRVRHLLTPRAQASGLCHQPRLPGQRVAQPPWLRTHDSSVNELFITYLNRTTLKGKWPCLCSPRKSTEPEA